MGEKKRAMNSNFTVYQNIVVFMECLVISS